MAAKVTTVPEGGFTLVHVSTTSTIPRSSGLTVLDVNVAGGIVAGQVFSQLPDSDDPPGESARPHYVMWWGSRDAAGTVVEEPQPGNISYYLASALAKRHYALARGATPVASYVGRAA